MDYLTRVFLFCVHQRLFAVDFAIARVHENGSIVSNRRDDAAFRRRVAAVVWIAHNARLGRVVASICCRYQGQIVFDAMKEIVGLTDEMPWLGVRPLELHAIRPRGAIGEVVSLGILEVEKIVKVLGRGVGEVIVCDKGNGLVA
jgi:hypothetical protein